MLFPRGDRTIGLDSRVICLVGIPNMVFILKKVRKPSGKKNKRAFPQGGPFLIQRQTREVFSSEKDLNRARLGAWSFSSKDKSHPSP